MARTNNAGTLPHPRDKAAPGGQLLGPLYHDAFLASAYTSRMMLSSRLNSRQSDQSLPSCSANPRTRDETKCCGPVGRI